MKNNLWDIKFIESNDVHDLRREFALLNSVHLVFF